ncbi:hypothetical protein B0T14DRAFT_604408 [Immersiella caudata]|uniref:Cytochrome b561 domain-containing protein n=1 Tax=Immersiella caudata TaxID=314043 RepID=A0AA39WSQ5_9PEZI|nr:hypothetical protein B0T14DRAFT_604408 [Immersiella caudata]
MPNWSLYSCQGIQGRNMMWIFAFFLSFFSSLPLQVPANILRRPNLFIPIVSKQLFRVCAMAKCTTMFYATRAILVALCGASFCAAAVQYCHEDTRIPVRFCMATETTFNSSSSKTDLLLTFGYQRSDYGGWSAVGIGSEMRGAIAFIGYMEHSSGDYGRPIVSIRRGRGHWEPRPSPKTLPQVDTISAALNTSGWFEASVVCYGCSGWEALDTTSSAQPWIWSTNTLQPFKDADAGTPLAGHTYFGHFDMDMTGAVGKAGASSSPVISGWGTIGEAVPAGSDLASKHKTQPYQWLFRLHGTFTSLAFTILYPCGALAIRSKSKGAFRSHVTAQLLATSLIAVGVSVALYCLAAQGSIGDYLSRPHVIVGISLVLLILLQILLGHRHHQAFIASRKASMATKGHTTVGYTIILGGCLNTWLGFNLAGLTRSITVFCLLLSLWDMSVIFVLLYKSHLGRKGPQEGTRDIGYEDSVPFLRLDNKQDTLGDE